MSSHMGTNFLNSCIKVPIDPCNNCPAPVYNRPKVFLSGSSTPPSKLITSNKIHECDLVLDTLYVANGMRSLATFYDSIPDYCEINHLPENEFYSTLEGLKMTYRHLKTQSNIPLCLRNESSTSLNYEIGKPSKIIAASSSKTKKRPMSRKSSAKKDDRNLSGSQCKYSYKDLCEKMKIFDYNQRHNDDERLYKDSVSQMKTKSNSLHKSLSMHHLAREDVQPKIHNFVKTSQTDEEKPIRRTSPKPRRTEILRKSFSFNDLNTKCWQEGPKTKADIILSRFSETNQDVVPNIKIQPPSPPSETKAESLKPSRSGSAISMKKKKFIKTKPDPTKVPFSFLGIDECSISEKTSSVSPIHPVARPNLAATLRLEVSKKKLKELQSTLDDQRRQVDWEVRKTPAWKSLSLNESHKEILALRLATRKAEQEHQKRQYQTHMEIMRQRVKSAPLLLEGSTFWGPHVGKLSHSCCKDNSKLSCQHGTNAHKKKKTNKPHSRKFLSSISYSRNSNHSTNLQESDALSSLDRAYL